MSSCNPQIASLSQGPGHGVVTTKPGLSHLQDFWRFPWGRAPRRRSTASAVGLPHCGSLRDLSPFLLVLIVEVHAGHIGSIPCVDRRLRVGPGRPGPAGCPRRTPGEVRRYNFELGFRERGTSRPGFFLWDTVCLCTVYTVVPWFALNASPALGPSRVPLI